MTTGATGQLGLALPVQGELSGTWGDTVNNGITQYTNIAIAGTLTLTNDGAVTLANTTGDASASNITSSLTGAGTVTAQFAIVRVTGTLTTAKVVTAPSYSKTYTVVNAATGGIVTFKASGQTGVSIAVGETAFVYFNGTDYVKVVGTATAGAAGGSNTQVQFNSSGVLAGSSNMTFDGTSLTLGGNPTLSAGTANGVTYLNGSKVLTSGSALTFNGTSLGVGSSDYGNAGSINLSVGVAATTTGGVQLWSTTSGTHYLQFGDGTAGAATYSGAVGYNHSADALLFLTSGSEQMRLTSTGLGIGTTSIGERLVVSGSASVDVYKLRSNTSAPASTDAFIYRPADNTIGFGTGSAEKMRLDSSGNLGIGTSSPDGKLDVAQAMINGSTSAFTSPHLALTATSSTDTTGFVGMTMATSDAANYGFSYGALRSNGGLGSLIWKYHFNSASGTELMRLDSYGNLGLGVTPSAWNSAYKALQFGTTGSLFAESGDAAVYLSSNSFINSAGTNTYITTDFATRYNQENGVHKWLIAPSGTAGNAITFTQAMTLDASGNLMVGVTTANATLHVQGATTTDGSIKFNNQLNSTGAFSSSPQSGSMVALKYNTAGDYAGMGGWSIGKENGTDGNFSSYFAMHTRANGGAITERARIDSGGSLLVGQTSSVTSGRGVTINTSQQGVVSRSGLAEYNELGVWTGTSDTVKAQIQANPSGTVLFGSRTNSTVLFTVSDTEKARIDTSGNLLVGTTTSHAKIAARSTVDAETIIRGDGETAGYYGTVFLANSSRGATTGYNLYDGYANGGLVFRVYGNGNVINTNNSYGAISDAKLKENIVDASPKLADMMQVKVRNYNLIGDTTKQLGVVAQELETVFPAMIDETVDRDAEGNDLGTTTKQVKYSVFVPMLIKAIQEQQAIIESLKARLDAANL